jgi:hypothetical protein
MTRALALLGLTGQDVKMAVRSFVFTFLAVFVPGALGWLHAWTEWSPGRPYPDFSAVAAAAVAGVVAAATGVLTLIVRAIEGKTGKGFLRKNPPKVSPKR